MTRKLIALLLSIMTIISVESIAIIPAQAADDKLTTIAEKDKEPPDGYILSLPDTEDIEVGKEGGVGEDGETSSNPQRANSISYSKYLGTRRYFGSIRYYDYECYRNTSNWIAFTGLNLTNAVYHKNGSGNKNLSFTKSQTYSSQTAANFSTSVGADAGVADMVKANVSLGAGITKTVGKSYQVSSTIQAEIPKSSKTGYYKMHVCYNFYRTKVIQKYANGNVAATKYISMPYGESYAAVLYSSSTANGSWSIW